HGIAPSASRLTKAYEPTPGAPGAGSRQETAPGRFWRMAVARKLDRVASGDAVYLLILEKHAVHEKIAWRPSAILI
ncbi:hypothetical protein Q9L58_008204, partial [Maublancomyces gigas]